MADLSALSSQIQELEYWADIWNTARLWLTAAPRQNVVARVYRYTGRIEATSDKMNSTSSRSQQEADFYVQTARKHFPAIVAEIEEAIRTARR